MRGLKVPNCNGRAPCGYAHVRWITIDCTGVRESAAPTRSSTRSSGVLFQPFFHIYFRYARIGREHIPKHGPVIVACNHRSFLDPFVIATMARRPMYYVAKKELFVQPAARRGC